MSTWFWACVYSILRITALDLHWEKKAKKEVIIAFCYRATSITHSRSATHTLWNGTWCYWNQALQPSRNTWHLGIWSSFKQGDVPCRVQTHMRWQSLQCADTRGSHLMYNMSGTLLITLSNKHLSLASNILLPVYHSTRVKQVQVHVYLLSATENVLRGLYRHPCLKSKLVLEEIITSKGRNF